MVYGVLMSHTIKDSHAHILEYGATKQLPLEGTKTIQGMYDLFLA
jgi:hypothetical protein